MAEIIATAEAGGITPSLYVLGAYERDVDLTVEEDPDKFMDAVNALYPAGGTENLYHAFQETIDILPSHSDIIVFTDEGSDDEPQLFDTVMSMAQDKQIKVTIIFSLS